jgi:peptidoglycan DL-endopeptidase CwlO
VGLSVPAAGPGHSPGPGSLAGTGSLAAGPGTARLTALTMPAARSGEGGSTPPVAPLSGLTEADLLVVAPASLTAKALIAIGKLPGVAATQPVEAGELKVNNTSAAVLGVNPSTFRGYTSKPVAVSNPLWQSVANGEAVVSTALGTQEGLSLSSVISVAGAKQQKLRIGALATTGIAGVDVVVSNAVAASLRMPASTAVVISAPRANPASLIMMVEAITPANTTAEPLSTQTTGGVVSRAQAAKMVSAAVSRVGMPYVYGAAGPTAFDCSGLVKWSFTQAGLAMPRVAAAQSMTGPAVSVTQLEPGDLLFYRTDPADPAYISHVAIYIGSGNMVQAPRRGEKVQVIAANITVDFAGAVRVDPEIAAALAR